jgi:hypothetical protein
MESLAVGGGAAWPAASGATAHQRGPLARTAVPAPAWERMTLDSTTLSAAESAQLALTRAEDAPQVFPAIAGNGTDGESLLLGRHPGGSRPVSGVFWERRSAASCSQTL